MSVLSLKPFGMKILFCYIFLTLKTIHWTNIWIWFNRYFTQFLTLNLAAPWSTNTIHVWTFCHFEIKWKY